MRALTLYQPWASLVALGVKSIETRSWKPSASAIGQPLAIHAGKRWEKIVVDPDGAWPWSAADRGFSYPVLDHWSPAEQRFVTYRLPLGAVIATCTLVDVVPMTESEHYRPGDDNYMEPHLLLNGLNGKLWLWEGEAHDVEGQRPYGDFSPGRYAWLISDVRALDEPIECRGRQGLWTLPEEVSQCLTATS